MNGAVLVVRHAELRPKAAPIASARHSITQRLARRFLDLVVVAVMSPEASGGGSGASGQIDIAVDCAG